VAELPTGTVTFLFTDVEGSTRLLQELGGEYAAVLEEHRRALREAFARHGGVEVDTQGDAFFIAFAKASDAIAAAAEGRDALAGGPIRVRMGLHTGEPVLADGGYAGIDVHRAARIAAAGHGGQILVSQATRDLTGGNGLRDLGEHRLKDLAAPERIYQLGDAGFPPLKSLNNSNLPLPADPLIGRKKELADVLRSLREGARLLTITGSGGIGKTRFALDVAAELIERFRDGVWWIGLAPVRDAKLVLPTVAATIGVKGHLEEELRGKELLLLLDNLEQVLDAAPDLAELQRVCGGVVLLVTSREPLHVAGEREYPLAPLSEAPAVELLRQRAEAITRDFRAGYRELAELCDRLDRLPLAIELAAARTKVLSVESLLERLDRRLPLLTSRRRDVDDRQRTLRATIEWSYDLLDDDEKQLFGRLAAFSGSFDATAAQEVCDADLEVLEALVDKSLLRTTHDRFFMLETIREYALERLLSSAEHEAIFRRHSDRALELARPPSQPQLRVEWRASIEPDYPNFRAALRRLRDRGEHEGFLTLVSRLGNYWDIRLELAEGRYWLEEALSTPYVTMTRERGRAIATLAHIRWRQGDMATARSLIDEAEAAARHLGDEALLADTHSYRGGIEYIVGNLDAARLEYERAVTLHHAQSNLALVAVMEHDLGLVALGAKEYGRARRHLEESLRLSREVGLDQYETGVLATVGHLHFEEGDLDRADDSLKEGLRLALERDVVDASAAHDLYILAAVTALRGGIEPACVLVGASDAAFDLIGVVREPPAESARSDVLRRAEVELGPDAVKNARLRGEALTIADAVRYAVSLD
jgi:predicted ATPase